MPERPHYIHKSELFRLLSRPPVWPLAPPTTTRGRQVDGYLAAKILSWKPQMCISSGPSQVRAPLLESIHTHPYFYLCEDLRSLTTMASAATPLVRCLRRRRRSVRPPSA